MNENVDLVLEYLGEKIGVAIPPAPDLTPYEKTETVDRKLSDLLGTEKPQAHGDTAPGTATKVAREDHIHPVQKDVEGNAGTANKLTEARTIALTGAAMGLPVPFDGSANIVIAVTTLDATKLTGTASVDTTGNAGSATRLANSRTISLSGAITGSGTFDGSDNLVITTSSNVVGLQLGNTVGQASGTASAGTASTAARSDHVHPLQTTVSGNAGSATKLQTARTISLSGAVSGSGSFDGSGNLAITTSSNIVGIQLGNSVGQAQGTAAAGTASTAARSDHVHPLQTYVTGNAGTATKLATARTITLSGDCSGSTSFDGSGNVSITTTVVNGGVQLGSTTPKAAGTAAAGTASTAARSDHVHPLQTTVSGNAGTATKLATSRTITLSGDCTGSTSFDGSGNVTIATTVLNGGVQLGNTAGQAAGTASAGSASTAARSDHVHPLQTSVTGNAGTATKLATARTITISGSVSGSASFDGSGNIAIATTGGVQLGSTSGAAPTSSGSAGSASTAARSDHTHPLQTTVSGNAGTATKWATSRTISLAGTVSGSASFDGSANASITTRLNNTSGGEIKFWTGTVSQLPSSRTSDTIYFVTD